MSSKSTDNLIEKTIKLFREKPYTLNMGAKSVGSKFKIPEQIIRLVRKRFREEADTTSRDSRLSVDNKIISRLDITPIKPKILLIDIETAPMIVDVWRLWNQLVTPGQVLASWFMLCYAAKWLGEDEVISRSLNSKEIKAQNDRVLALELRNLLDEADIIITYNGVKFDIPKINTRLLLHNIPTPSLYKHVDLYTTIKKEFAFESNSLDYVNKKLDIPTKISLDKSIWINSYMGNMEALDELRVYNENDVIILEDLYNKLKPWIKGHPNVTLYEEKITLQCGVCGSSNLTASKYEYTAVGKYPTFECNDCGSIVRGRKSVLSAEDKKNLLKNR